MEKFIAENKADIDLSIGRKPKDFSAKTIDGKTFNSTENKGKLWLIFVYDRDYLTKTETYDLVADVKQAHIKYGDKIAMLGIVSGFSDDEPSLRKLLTAANIPFRQIDNTEGPGKEVQLKDNVICTPARILIGTDGKVIYNKCGGNLDMLEYKLDSLIKLNK